MTSSQGIGGQWAEPVRQQPNRLDQRDVLFRPIGDEQRQPHDGGAPIAAVAYEPSPGPLNTLCVRPQRCCGDVLVVMDRDVNVVEGINEFAGRCIGSGEVRVQDRGDIHADQPLIFWHFSPGSSAVLLLIGVRLAVTR